MPGTSNKTTTHVGNDNKPRRKAYKTFSLNEFHTLCKDDAENFLHANYWTEKVKIPAHNSTLVKSAKATSVEVLPKLAISNGNKKPEVPKFPTSNGYKKSEGSTIAEPNFKSITTQKVNGVKGTKQENNSSFIKEPKFCKSNDYKTAKEKYCNSVEKVNKVAVGNGFKKSENTFVGVSNLTACNGSKASKESFNLTSSNGVKMPNENGSSTLMKVSRIPKSNGFKTPKEKDSNCIVKMPKLPESNGFNKSEDVLKFTEISNGFNALKVNGSSSFKEVPEFLKSNGFKLPEDVSFDDTLTFQGCNGFKTPEDDITLADKSQNVSFTSCRRGRGRGRIRSCRRIPTPTRNVPPELQSVDKMTSADFRHDYGAHVETMRIRQKDQQHMRFFQSIIENNKHLFVGRTILNLSCGTGTLALMAARAGAARVYALDYSNVTDYARLVVKENHYEHIITVLHGHVADVKLPKNVKIDGIICNWMGHSLLYESELVQLLQARDRWLKPNGFILPDLGALYLMGGSEQVLKNERCNWWLNVYGFNMKAMRRYSLSEPRYASVKGKSLLTLAHKVMSLDLNTATLNDLQIDRSIRLKVQNEGYLECFVLYFDVAFSRAHQPQKLSCNPWLGNQLKSLWLQTVLFVDQPFVIRATNNYTGHLVFKPLKKQQQLNLYEMKIEIEFYVMNNNNNNMNTYNNNICDPLVLKSWLMLPRFQTTQEVADCQDRRQCL